MSLPIKWFVLLLICTDMQSIIQFQLHFQLILDVSYIVYEPDKFYDISLCETSHAS